MTQLENAVLLLINVFDKYADTDGKKESLTKAELKKLLECELPGLLQGGKGKDDCDKLIKDLDENGDSEVDFKEFIIFVASFTCLAHEKFQKCAQKCAKK
ncbi:PREDICTED: protein S100-P-like [Nanorana parkeri]|uniref:protein S100-P-like n=1 Tax=Nanorana parkeri TaxID=125878 RepID=UPI000854D9E4|nr:PREDICTED: protein S100-P-like [Nanorana parkeri]